jgi:hypothetical protein
MKWWREFSNCSVGMVNTTPDLLFGALGKPALDQIQPRRGRRSEMQVEAWTFGQPAANQLGFVSAVVIQDEVHVKFCGYVMLDGIGKSAEFTER